MKYVSIVRRCVEGGDCVSAWITEVISAAGSCQKEIGGTREVGGRRNDRVRD